MKNFILALLLALPVCARAGEPVYKDPSATPDARAEDLLSRMTLDEKIDQLSGINSLDLRPNARLGIPSLRMTDGPIGVRIGNTTAFPSGIAMASSFDPGLLGQVAGALGEETLALGRDMLLGPCINIARAPVGGRNFESYGEDPYLAARFGEAYVKALQARGVLASTKHYALNNQETERMSINVIASERAMQEIYLPAFHAAVDAGTLTIMAAYNRINGSHAAQNDYLLNQVLKKDWGFKGFVVSDWGATHSTVESANNGLDVEMPDGEFFGGGKLQQAVKDGKVSEKVIDDKVRRVLRTMFASGLFERKASDRPAMSVISNAGHRALALKMAQEGIVLLKNEDGVLPIKPGTKTVAVIGPNADAARAGGGSSEISPAHTEGPLAALEEAAPSIKFTYAQGVNMPGAMRIIKSDWLYPPAGKGDGHGLLAEYYGNKTLSGPPESTTVEATVDHEWGDNARQNFSVRWTGRLRVPEDGTYELSVNSDDGIRMWLDGEKIVDDWNDHAPVVDSKKMELRAGKDYDIKIEYYQASGGATAQLGIIDPGRKKIAEAAEAAKNADAALVFVGTWDKLESEGRDRDSMRLPEGQDELIKAVAAANKNVVVVIQCGSPVLMNEWLDKVKGVVFAWYPGQEGGYALADILLGKVNPSGKSPITFPQRWEDSPAAANYPGKDGSVNYAEGIFVGYRYFDHNGIKPLFPFGYGLSYTTFAYSNMAVKAVDNSAAQPQFEVSVDVKNTGNIAGAEIAQLYVHDAAPKLPRPDEELKGFARVELNPGETKSVSFKLDKSSFAYYDEVLHGWTTAPGAFEVRIGASSRDIRQSAGITLK